MSQRKSSWEIQKQFNILKTEDMKDSIVLESQKKSLSEEIKKFKQVEIKNTIKTEPKYTIWQRILKTVGMN
jgi:hypothetical protein